VRRSMTFVHLHHTTGASEVRLVTSYKHIVEEGGELEKLSLTRTMPHDVSFGLRRNIDIAFRAVGVLAAKRL